MVSLPQWGRAGVGGLRRILPPALPSITRFAVVALELERLVFRQVGGEE